MPAIWRDLGRQTEERANMAADVKNVRRRREQPLQHFRQTFFLENDLRHFEVWTQATGDVAGSLGDSLEWRIDQEGLQKEHCIHGEKLPCIARSHLPGQRLFPKPNRKMKEM